MVKFDKDKNGEIIGRYVCDVCHEVLPHNERGFSVGKILVDLEDLTANHFCNQCVSELMLKI